MKSSRQSIKFCHILVYMSFLVLASCQTEPDLDAVNGGDDNNENNNPDQVFTADELAGFLILQSASKITGSIPIATSGPVQINVRDSIFVMKDFSYGTGVVVKHDGLYEITGFYVGVPEASFYYDVPIIPEQSGDSTDVVFLNTVFPVSDFDGDFPFSFPIVLLPHVNGIPVKEFIRTLTVEDPDAEDTDGNPRCQITSPAGAIPSPFLWKWEFTRIFSTDNTLLIEDGPGKRQITAYQTGGCCNDDGTSTTVGTDPNCSANKTTWRSIDVAHYFQWNFDVLEFYDDGTFYHENESEQTNYRSSLSNFCAGDAFYDIQKGYYQKRGTHDYTSGTDFLTIQYNTTNPPVFGKTIKSGLIFNTCHLLNFIYLGDGTIIVQFKKEYFIHNKYRSWYD